MLRFYHLRVHLSTFSQILTDIFHFSRWPSSMSWIRLSQRIVTIRCGCRFTLTLNFSATCPPNFEVKRNSQTCRRLRHWTWRRSREVALFPKTSRSPAKLVNTRCAAVYKSVFAPFDVSRGVDVFIPTDTYDWYCPTWAPVRVDMKKIRRHSCLTVLCRRSSRSLARHESTAPLPPRNILRGLSLNAVNWTTWVTRGCRNLVAGLSALYTYMLLGISFVLVGVGVCLYVARYQFCFR